MIFPSNPSEPDGSLVRPMTVWAAVAWAFGIHFLHIFLISMHLAVRPGEERDVITMFGWQLVAYLLGLFGVLRVHAPLVSIRDLCGVRATHAAAYVGAILLGLAILLPVNELYTVILQRFPAETPTDDLVATLRDSSRLRLWGTGVVFVLLVPIIEEVFYRGALFRPLLKHMGPVGAIAVTSLLFATAHETRAIVPIAFAGAALGFVRWQTGSIFCSILLHMTFNAVPFYETLVEVGRETTSPLERMPLSWVALGIVVAAAVVASFVRLAPKSEVVQGAQERDLA